LELALPVGDEVFFLLKAYFGADVDVVVIAMVLCSINSLFLASRVASSC